MMRVAVMWLFSIQKYSPSTKEVGRNRLARPAALARKTSSALAARLSGNTCETVSNQIETIRSFSGSGNKEIKIFKRKLIAALNELKE